MAKGLVDAGLAAFSADLLRLVVKPRTAHPMTSALLEPLFSKKMYLFRKIRL